MKKSVVICSPKRSSIGSFQGALSSVSAPDLGARVVKAVVEDSQIPTELISDIIAGCVVSAGIGQAPARQVMIKAGLPLGMQAMTINKVCSSGLKAVQLAAMMIEAGQAECLLAGGMESMSQAPYLSKTMRTGARLGHTAFEDSLLVDGLLDAFDQSHMGTCAELCAREHDISRNAQDAFAVRSYERAQKAIHEGHFKNEIVPLQVSVGKKTTEVVSDEEPLRVDFAKIPSLRPVFDPNGSVTAANASTLNDGAAFMIVCSEQFAEKNNLHPMARLVSVGWNALEPKWFTVAPVGAMAMAMQKADVKVNDIDLFEVNEAFSVVALACQKQLMIPDDKLNISGGAVALGHPLGASGARILTTLIHNLHRTGSKKGLVGICNGGGEATSVVVEAV